MSIRAATRILQACVLWLCPLVAASDDDTLMLIVNRDAGITAIDTQQAVNLFMGRYNLLPSGISAIPVDYVPHRSAFYQQLVGKTLAEINGYWARLVFSGRASPPLQLHTPDGLLQFVANNRGAIGYLPREAVDGRVLAIPLPDAGRLTGTP